MTLTKNNKTISPEERRTNNNAFIKSLGINNPIISVIAWLNKLKIKFNFIFFPVPCGIIKHISFWLFLFGVNNT